MTWNALAVSAYTIIEPPFVESQIRTPTEVVLATDSQGTFLGRAGKREQPICKIYQPNGVLFANGGFERCAREARHDDALGKFQGHICVSMRIRPRLRAARGR